MEMVVAAIMVAVASATTNDFCLFRFDGRLIEMPAIEKGEAK